MGERSLDYWAGHLAAYREMRLVMAETGRNLDALADADTELLLATVKWPDDTTDETKREVIERFVLPMAQAMAPAVRGSYRTLEAAVDRVIGEVEALLRQELKL
jgi:hypothetical protein